VKDAVLAGVPLETAIRVCGENPAKANGLWPVKGCIREDSDGDFVILDEELNIDTVIAKGRIMVQSKTVLVKGTFEE
jgi:beta-aspartyl-dipeptidase (metallo-type)